jgi:palmitoyltransferase
MTTNESSKWSDWKEDVVDDLVFKAELTRLRETAPRGAAKVHPDDHLVRWSRRAKWWMTVTRDGKHPRLKYLGEAPGTESLGEQDERFVRVMSMKEVDNLYDLGFWNNFKDLMFNRGGFLRDGSLDR